MKRKHRLALAQKRRKSGWNYNPDFPIEKCPDLNTGKIIPILDGCAFLMKPKWPNGKIIRDGRLKVTQPCVVESDSHKRSWVFDGLTDRLSSPFAWAHLQLENVVLEVESVVPRRLGKRQYEVDATLRLRVKTPPATQAPETVLASAA